MTTFPTTAGQLLAHLEVCGQADAWIVSTDPADVRDQCGSLRRTFRLRTLGDAAHGLVCEFGAVFIVLEDGGFDCLLSDLYRPDRLRDVIEGRRWATPDAMAFIDSLERAFPHERFARPPKHDHQQEESWPLRT